MIKIRRIRPIKIAHGSTEIKYISHIDGLRAIAVLTIILFHLDLNKGGYIGVDVFFVISGFLITRLMLKEINTTHDFSFKHFYMRRARRILPALFFTLLFTLLFAFLLFTPEHFQSVGDVVWQAAIAISNFAFWRESDYFDVSSSIKPLLHTWSLGVEEQFYLFWPLSLILFLKISHKIKTYYFIIAMCVCSYGLIYVFQAGTVEWVNELVPYFENGKSTTFFLVPFRMYELLMGSLLLWFYNKKPKSDIVSFIGLLLIILPSIFFSSSLVHQASWNILPCIGACLLIHSGSSKYCSKFLTNIFFKKTGEWSYSLYLIHWPLIVFFMYYKDTELSLLQKAEVFAATYVLAFLMNTFIENPFRYGKNNFYLKKPTFFIAACVLGVTFFYFVGNDINDNDGWIWRVSDEQQKLAETLKNPKAYHIEHFGGAKHPFVGCIDENDQCETVDIILIGDSHIQQYTNGFYEIFVKKYHKKNIYCFLESNFSA